MNLNKQWQDFVYRTFSLSFFFFARYRRELMCKESSSCRDPQLEEGGRNAYALEERHLSLRNRTVHFLYASLRAPSAAGVLI